MVKAGGWWIWPNKTKDEIWYDYDAVVKKIKPPVEVNKRGFLLLKN